MAEFRIRVYTQQLLYDYNNYVVVADTIEEAALQVAELQKEANARGNPIYSSLQTYIVDRTGTISQTTDNAYIRKLDPVLLPPQIGLSQINDTGNIIRDLSRTVEYSGFDRRGEPLDIDWSDYDWSGE